MDAHESLSTPVLMHLIKATVDQVHAEVTVRL